MPTRQQQTARSPVMSSEDEPQLIAIDPARVFEVLALPDVRKLMLDLVDRDSGELSYDGVTRKLAAAEWILWLVWSGRVRAILATELYFDVSRAKRCRIPFCTGDGAQSWVHLLSRIEDFARSEGCEKIDMIARKGWAKHLKDYKMTHVLLEKDL